MTTAHKTDPPAACEPHPSTRQRIIPMPALVRKLFSACPMYTWPAAHSVDDKAPVRPILYIAPPVSGTASAEPGCHRWQLELAWRGVSFDAVPLTGYCWGPNGRLPFLHDTAERGGRIVGADELAVYVDTHFPAARPELKESPALPEEAGSESFAWQSLLEGRVMAGALLLALQSGTLDGYGGARPCFFRSILPQLPGERTLPEAALVRLNELSSAGASVTSVNATAGRKHTGDVRNPIARVPGFTVDWTSWITGTSSDNTDPDDLELPDMELDRDAIAAQAGEALSAVGERLGDDTWLLGATRPTSLDALLVAALHTINAHAREGPLFQAAKSKSLVAYASRTAE